MFDLKNILTVVYFGLSFGLTEAALSASDPVVVGQTFVAGNVDPTDGSAGWALTSHGVGEKLFTVDKDGELIGQVGESVNKIDEFTWDVVLKEGYKFSDGTVVDAEHVATSLNELNTKNPSAQSSLGNMTATAQDDGKVRIVSERTTHVMDAVLAEWVFVIFTTDSSGNFLFTGPYAIESYSAEQIDLIPNPHYDSQSLERPIIKVKKYSDGDLLAEAAKNHEIDIGFHLPISKLPEVKEMDGVSIKSFEVGYQYMMFHNMDSLQDLSVRKAIDTAIDRSALSTALEGGVGTRSLFPDNSPYYSDETDPRGSLELAKAILEEDGWMLNANGKREKNGEELTINLVAYPHRPGLGIMQPVIEDSLTALGMTVTSILTSQDWDETQAIIDDRSFDLLLWAQHTLPAGDPMWFLSAFFRTDGGSNHANLQSEAVDTMLNELSLAEDHLERVSHTAETQALILSEVPVSSLVTPYWHVSLSDRLADYDPWGSDYYVIRADLFAKETMMDGEPATVAPVEESVSSSASMDEEPAAMEEFSASMDESSGSKVGLFVGTLVSLMISALIF